MSAELRATYRLQLGPDLSFDQAAALVPYLAKLGVSHVYCSPILQAAEGSTHGYDVVDPTQVSAELGGRQGFDRLVAAAHAGGLGVMVDIVPNHMSVADSRNAWWWDVLENGPSARAAHVFDVDWDPPEERLRNVVLLPVLGDHRGRCMARKEISIVREGPRFVVRYFDHRFPVAPRPVADVLRDTHPPREVERLAFIADSFESLPLPTALDVDSVERRHRDRVVIYELLGELLEREPAVGTAIDAAVARLNDDIDALAAFLERQNYRLAFWRAAERDLDYRRFFDVTSLVGLRAEDPRTFDSTHRLIGQLLRQGDIDALRVDHVDGVADPDTYLRRLRALAHGVPIYVEKILSGDEELPAWPVQGTTGYEHMHELMRAWIDPAGEAPLGALTAELVGERRPFAEIATQARYEVLDDLLGSDLRRLAHVFVQLCDRHPDISDFSRRDCTSAVSSLIAAFPVYRAYVRPGEPARVEDVRVIEEAYRIAREQQPELDETLVAALRDVLLGKRTGPLESELVRRFQQLTPPAFAKGVEDTAFYRDTRLCALDDVGGDPALFSIDVEALHAWARKSQASWPRRMLASSTHDTKRSEDVRARMILLAEDHEAFATFARLFFQRIERHRTDGAPAPRLAMIALQTMVGAWPISAERTKTYLHKAARETKQETSWTRQDEAYEKGIDAFVDKIFADPELIEAFGRYVDRIAPASRAVSLGWLLLKVLLPGVPDFYQGSELWTAELVDPDNRTAVDFARRAQMLDSLAAPPEPTSDEAKLWVTARALAVRRDHAAAFGDESGYEPLVAGGPDAARVIAFERAAGDHAVIAVATRWPLRGPVDAKLALPRGRWKDALSERVHEGEVGIAALHDVLPVALLVRQESP